MPRRGFQALIAAGVLLAAAEVTTLVAQTSPEPLNHDGHPVLIGLSKQARGSVHVARQRQYRCRFGGRVITMVDAVAEGTFEVSSHSNHCDELADLLNGRMDVRLELLVRAGELPFGTVDGRFTIRQGDQRANGNITGMFGCGSHHEPVAECERCRKPGHLEFTLTGAITQGRLRGARIRATGAGQLDAHGDQILGLLTIDGGYLVRCEDHDEHEDDHDAPAVDPKRTLPVPGIGL